MTTKAAGRRPAAKISTLQENMEPQDIEVCGGRGHNMDLEMWWHNMDLEMWWQNMDLEM